MKILGIESSCDETSASIIEGKKTGSSHTLTVLSNIISSQIELHKKYGGVVPEIAAREHVLNIIPVINECLQSADINMDKIKKEINAIAVTVGPGLITSLITGVETAKVLAYCWNIPLIKINHIEGHIYANFIGENQIKFPAVILTVSGGHTMLLLMHDHGKFKTLGETRDDAAGEAFDKAAKLMEIGYPGGPIISKTAESFKEASMIRLPRPMIKSNDYDFSFSGLKTALLYEIQQDKNWKKRIPEYSFEFEQAIVDVLISKTISAGKKFNAKTIMISGGVAANKKLRAQMKERIKKELPQVEFNMPDLKYTTDNAAMIAAAGYFHALKKDFIVWEKIRVDSNLELK